MELAVLASAGAGGASGWAQVLGGVGLFLTGMVLVTDGLREAAGDTLRRALLRFTAGPGQALATGAVVTALVQSSSATTTATIGFVSAGLLSFEQALGLIFGANIGTTATGWMVATLGLKVSMSAVALPLVGAGAFMRLIGRGRLVPLGMAVAGFGMLFVGLDLLQAGMAGASALISPDRLPSDTWLGRVGLVGIGAALTAVMQSSSAAMATTLTALHSGNVSMVQAAAMAIGINIGTTVTAGLAIIGSGVAARRTGLAHVLFNVITGVVAFALLPVLVPASAWLSARLGSGDPVITLSVFHTLFNILGVALVMPLVGRFAALVERAIPDRGPRFSRALVPALAEQGALAIEAARHTTLDIFAEALRVAQALLAGEPLDEAALDEARQGVRDTYAFLAAIDDMTNVDAAALARHTDLIHALDHLNQLLVLLSREAALLGAATPADARAEVGPMRVQAVGAVIHALEWSARAVARDEALLGEGVSELAEASRELADARRGLRAEALARTARGEVTPEEAERLILTAKRLDQLAYYLWRLTSHLTASLASGPLDDDAARRE